MRAAWISILWVMGVGWATGCKADQSAEAATASAKPPASASASATAAVAAKPSWVDKVTGDGFAAWINSHPGGCDCSVTETKKEGAVSIVRWQIHQPGDSSFMSFVTTVSEHGGQGIQLSYDLGQKFPGCVRSDVGNKVIVTTRSLAVSTTAMYPNGKYEVKACEGSGWSLPEGVADYFAK